MNIKENKDLPGVRTIDLNVLPDERGFFTEALRFDWQELLGDDQIVQANMSYSYPGVVRAWHRHVRGQVDYFLVLNGALKICAYDDREDVPETKGKLAEIVVSSCKPQIVRIPGFYWHGFKNIHHEPTLLMYFVTRLYDYSDPDEERRPWNDAAIINHKTQKPFDWMELPYK